jgi:CBS domain-containing protein
MRARDLARSAVVVEQSEDALTVLRRLARSGQPGLVVLAPGGPVVVPAARVLRVALPAYVLDDPSLGRVWDEASADRLAGVLAGRHVADLLGPLDGVAFPRAVVEPDATLVEIVDVMAEEDSPLVAVMDGSELVGVVTAAQVLDLLVA